MGIDHFYLDLPGPLGDPRPQMVRYKVRFVMSLGLCVVLREMIIL